MKQARNIFIFLIMSLAFFSCKKWSDPEAPNIPGLNDRKYCNDPEAVNYNWNFPGQPDNTTCFYPTDLFAGTYTFTDSIYGSGNVFDSARSLTTYILQFIALDRHQMAVVGFCGPNDSLKFTAERTTYQAHADTTIHTSDTSFAYGQFFCSALDTLSGTISRNRFDTSSHFGLLIDFTVVSDTGINFHRGTAIKQ